MRLKDKLSHLRGGAPLSSSEKQPNLATGSSGTATSNLDELRAKMDAILGRPPAPAREPALPRDPLGDLPFVRIDSPAGILTQRLQLQKPSACVGRIPMGAARTADMEVLSLLALTPALAGLDPRRALYIDTETTGLGGAGTVAFLVGLAWFDQDGCLILEQLLLASPHEEVAFLEWLRERIAAASFLVSFNGKSFDMPLLNGRYVMNQLPALAERPHLDLLHLARRLHKRRLARCRLIHLESEVLGWERHEDDIPGAEIAPRYGHFLRTGDSDALRGVIDHNAWDVLSMAALVGLYGQPLFDLPSSDLLGAADTFIRARAHGRALEMAERVLCSDDSEGALHSRARIFKALGDRARALKDFEALSGEVDDPGVRLELAKLYEHHAKDYRRALEVLGRGLAESSEKMEHRRQRLQKKAVSGGGKGTGGGKRVGGKQRTPPVRGSG